MPRFFQLFSAVLAFIARLHATISGRAAPRWSRDGHGPVRGDGSIHGDIFTARTDHMPEWGSGRALRFLVRRLALFGLIVGMLGTTPVYSASLTTQFSSNNGQDGNMFDVVTFGNSLTVSSLSLNLDSGTHTVRLYTRSGTWVGFENSPAGWTLVDTSTVASAGLNNPTFWDLLDFVLPANSRTALYVTISSGGAPMNYTNGRAVSNVAASNGDLQIFEGAGKSFAFSATFSPRIWNGTITYAVGAADTTPPLFLNIPPDFNVEATSAAGAIVNFTPPTANDAVDGAVAVTSSPASGSQFPLGNTTITYTATDAAGNTATATTVVTVQDTTSPIVTAPAGITAEATSAAGAVVNFTPTATDTVGVTSLISVPVSGSTFAIGTTSVTVTALDAAGNSNTATFNVTVQDTIAPVIAGMPSDITQNTDAGVNSAVVTWPPPTASDNVGVTSFTSPHNPGDTFALGTTTVTYTALDAAGKSSTASFTVTVSDGEKPVIAGMPADITQNTDAGVNTAVVTWTAPTASDNVGVTSFTSTHNPGDTFPLGTTTVTYTALDAAGKSSTASFTVTVSDGENPVITGMPADIVIDVDYPNSSSVAAWTAPTASDNDSIASFTSNHNSGDAFPLGTSVVIYTATDNSGNVTTASFNITVNQIPPGHITMTVVSDVSDGTFNFTSSTPQLNFALTTIDGAAQSTPVTIKPGTYVVTATLPSGFGLVSGSCTDADSTVSVGAKTATINLQSGEQVTCLFTAADSRTKTTRTIARFLKRRNDRLLSTEPGTDRQIARLNRAQGGGGGQGAGFAQYPPPRALGNGGVALSEAGSADATGGGAGTTAGAPSRVAALDGVFSGTSQKHHESGLISRLPFGLSLMQEGRASISFSTSLSELRRHHASEKQRRVMGLLGKEGYAAAGAGRFVEGGEDWALDIWAEGRFSYFDDDSNGGKTNGNFGVLYLGADYVVNPSFLVGVLAQFDDTKETSQTDSTHVHGKGWMVGPYTTVKLSPNLYFQGRAAWGRSNNDISPFLTYTDNFDTERWLVRGKLQGVWNYGNFRFSPSASAAYIEERQGAYTDSLGVFIPGQSVSLGQAEFGPEASYSFGPIDGFRIMPRASLKGVWNFAEDNGVLAGTSVGTAYFRGKAGVGLKIEGENGASLDFGGTYDGIGAADFRAVSGSVKLRLPLN